MRLSLPNSISRLVGRYFNLNDPGWGRDASGKPPEGGGATPPSSPPPPPASPPPPPPPPSASPPPPQRPKGNDGPPDLDEVWRDFNRKLSSLFGGKGKGGGNFGNNSNNSNNGDGFGPDMKSAGIGAGVVAGILVLLWASSGFFIVQEGQQAAVLQFGKYKYLTEAGFNWRMPFPIQSHEIVNVSSLRSVEIGKGTGVNKATALRESSMLTMDENIIDVRFAVQYRVNDPQMFLFNNKAVEETVNQAAETAVREIVGRSKMDTVLYAGREKVADDLKALTQKLLDEYKTGIQIASVTIANVQPPEQVQAAFDDAVKAGQDFERAKSEGLAYKEDVIPKARGQAARLTEEAKGYTGRIVAQAEGDAERFKQIYTEYAKAPGVTRDRMYLDTMQQVFSNVSKVLVDSKQGSNLLYLPLDKIIAQTAADSIKPVAAAAAAPAPEPPAQSRADQLRARGQ